MFFKKLKFLIALIFSMVAVSGCVGISDYSLEAYSNATELKARSLLLVDESGGRYSDHKTEVDELKTDLNIAYEFAEGLEKNNLASLMWAEIVDPEAGSIGGLLQVWEKKQPQGVSAKFRENFREEVEFGFNRLICLEANKREATKCPSI